jgi:hypothetical protein
MNLDLTPHEIKLCALALQRMRLEIDVDGKCQTMNGGQTQACRFTIMFVDALGRKFTDAIKESIDEPH